MINEDGTTEVNAIERVNKQHLVQALLMLATAETGHERAKQEEAQCAAQGQPRPDGLRGDDDAR